MKTLFVSDIRCEKCVANVSRALDSEGIEHGDVILSEKTVDVADNDIQKAIEVLDEIGFSATIK